MNAAHEHDIGIADRTAPSGSRVRRLRTALRGAFRPVTARRTDLSTSATVNAQFWIGQMPWRVTAAWAALAGLLAASRPPTGLSLTWPSIVLLLLLVDPLWGALWRLAAGRVEQLPLHERVIGGRFWLPYLKDGSPAAHVFGRNTGETLPVLFRVAFPAVAINVLVASALGVQALLATALLVLLTLFGWISTRRAHNTPVFLHSVVTVALPWLTAALIAGAGPTAAGWGALAGMVALWTLHQTGAGRLTRNVHDLLGLALLGVADLGIAGLLIWLQTPLWLALWLICALPTWLTLVQRRSLSRVALWHVGALLAGAAALGQAVF